MLRKLLTWAQSSSAPTDDHTHDDGAERVTSWEIRALLRTLERIPRTDLPDGGSRQALEAAIRAGRVDNLYQPLGCDHWNISWADRPAWVDPRQNIMSWILEYRAGQGGQGA